jgi:hypothetical protein|tara:strand:- start:475 stop:579 length:105 start_codon:yes stop_codon:yes gene_type:complete
MITDEEYRDIGVGVLRVAIVAFALGVLTGYFIFN